MFLKQLKIISLSFIFQFTLTTSAFSLRADSTSTIPSSSPVFIRKIVIHRHEIFNTGLKEFQKFPFPLVNKLHIKTKSSVVYRELLFQAGEPIDYDLLAESERNLRALQFIGEASVAPVRVKKDSVDIIVTVADQWTTVLGTKYEVQAGRANYGLRVEEYNLLGWGQKVKASIARIEGRTQQEFYFAENRLLNSRWKIRYHFKGFEYGRYYSYLLQRPFFAERTRWALDFDYENYQGSRFLYANEFTLATYQADEQKIAGRISNLLFRRDHTSTRLSFLYYENTNKYVPLSVPVESIEYIPPGENDKIAAIGCDWVKLGFIKEKFIDNFGLIEDISVGSAASFYFGRSLTPLFHSLDNRWYILGRFANSYVFGRDFYLYHQVEGYSFVAQNRLEETVMNFRTTSYLKTFHRQTIVANAQLEFSWRMPPNRQLFLGENRGLRGYPNYFKTGQNRFILNLENRIHPFFNAWSFGLGGAVFTDLGYIWTDSPDFKLNRPFIAVGLGLRIGSTKTKGSSLFRFDLAVTFDDHPRFVLSFGNSHFFKAIHNFKFVSSFPKKFGEYKE